MLYAIEDIKKQIVGDFLITGQEDSVKFDKVRPINEADENTLVWLNPNRKDKKQLLEATRAKVIICSLDEAEHVDSNKVYVHVKEPKLVYLRIVDAYFTQKPAYGIHESAVIHPEAKIHKNVYIGPLTYVGKAVIGENTLIMGSCHIMDQTQIGKDVMIQPGTVIGAEGFGYARNENGQLERFPHIGGVVIEDDVEIGANTCIDRGTLGNTLVRKGAKIDNLVHIAHNADVGENAAVIAHAMVAGSTKIGANSWIAPSSCLRDGIEIGRNATVGLAALVTKNIPDNEVWAGFPARKIR